MATRPRGGPAERVQPALRRTTPTQTRSWAPVRSSSRPAGRPLRSDFRSMLNRQSRERLEQLGHRGTACSPAIRAAATCSAVRSATRPPGVGDPVEHRVVEGQQHAVAGGVHVGLEVAVAERDGVPEGVQRVLGAGDLGVQRTAAVGHRDHRAGLVEHGVEVGVPGHGRDSTAGSASREQYSPASCDGAPESPRGPSAFRLRRGRREEYASRHGRDDLPAVRGHHGRAAHRPRHGPAVRVLPGRVPRARRPRQPGRGRERLARPPLRRHRAAARGSPPT